MEKKVEITVQTAEKVLELLRKFRSGHKVLYASPEDNDILDILVHLSQKVAEA